MDRQRSRSANAPPIDEHDHRLEAVTLESEISMSIVTNRSAFTRRRFFDRITGRGRNGTGATAMTDTSMSEPRRCWNLNVEPALLMVSLGMGLMMNSNALFTYWARCIEMAEEHKGSNATALCSMLSGTNNTDFNDLVEKDIASTRIYIQIAGTIPTLIVAPIIGNWSDHSGRRRPLLLSLFGLCIHMSMMLMATLTYERISVYRFMFAAEIISGCTGGMATLFTCLLSIVTDDCRTTLKPGNSDVPMRMAISTSLQAVGGMLGSLVMSWLSVPAIVSVDDHVGAYVKAALTSLVLIVAAFVYTVAFVRETHSPTKELFAYESHSSDEDLDQRFLVDSSIPHRRSHHLSKKLRQLVEVLTERRPGNTRLCLNLSLVFVFVEFLALDAQLLFLLLKRQPFAWTDKMFSLLSFLKSVCLFTGMLCLPLIMRRINVLGKDSLLIGIGVISGAISFFILSAASTTEMIVIATLCTILAGAVAPGYRSFLPRMVPKEQTARLLTVCSIIMSICPILSALVFNNLFNWSLSFWPGLAFFVGGCFQVVVAFGQIAIHMLMRPQWIKEEESRSHRLLDDCDDEEEEEEREGSINDEVMDRADDERSVSNEGAAGSYSPSNFSVPDQQPIHL